MSYIVTASINKKMKKSLKDIKEADHFPKELGLKNCHTYHLVKIQQVKLDNGDLEYLCFMRNPTGNIYLKDGEVSKLQWSPRDDQSWTPKLRQQCNYYTTKEIYENTLIKSKKNRKRLKMGQVDRKTLAKKQKRKGKLSKRDTYDGLSAL